MNKLPFEFEQPQDSPGFLLWQTTTVWQRLINNKLEPYDITHPEFVIMALLLWLSNNDHNTTQVLISKWSKLDKMTVSKSVRKLEKIGHIKREQHELDSRAKNVFLTDSGVELISKLVPVIEDIDERFFGKLSESEQQELIRIFKKLETDVIS